MLGELIEVAGKLLEFSDRLKQAEERKRQIIEDYFLKIEQCLCDTAKQLKEGQTPDDTWAELKVYADELPNTIVDQIGQDKANEISRLLRITASKTPEKLSIKEIKTAAGKFKGLVAKIRTDSTVPKPRPLIPLPLSRRSFIWTSVGTSVGLTAGWLGGRNVHLLPINWKMVSFLKENANKLIVYKAPQMICDRVREMTKGGFNIEIDKNEKQPIATQDILKNVSDGNIECGYSGIYYNDERYKVLFFGCAIPFGLTPQEQTAWLLYKKNPDDALTFIQQIYSTKLNLNVIPFPAAATGGQMGGWFNNEVNTVADFQGIKMRIPGLGGKILQQYFGVILDKDLPGGAIPIDQIADELEKGNINGAEFIGPYDDLQLGLHKVAKYYYYPCWSEPSTTLDILVNKNAWNKLPKEYQQIFQAACFETYTKILAEYDIKNSEALQQLRQFQTSGRIRLVRFSNEILQEARKKTDELLKIYSSNSTFKEVYDEWSNFRNQVRDWSNINRI